MCTLVDVATNKHIVAADVDGTTLYPEFSLDKLSQCIPFRTVPDECEYANVSLH